ncbi:MAG TPA: gliding motility-associated C-terminal domain-containing protein [Puia sp.]
MKAAVFAYLLTMPLWGWSQAYPLKGQLAATAFPICAQDTFKQGDLPNGFNASIPMPGCDSYGELNPFYYRFTCFSAGSLGFIIIPNLGTDNYDWVLFDITGVLPSTIFIDPTLIVTGNRSSDPGNTGAKLDGTNNNICPVGATDNPSSFTRMPNLQKGHEYLLLITHPMGPQSGYSLAFGGGDAVLNDPDLPDLLSVRVSCDKKTLTVGITKFVLCSSLAADGSDFSITNYTGTILTAVGLNCNPQFDYDYLELSLSDPLPPGNYSLVLQNGTDHNTLLEYCGRQMQAGDHLDFTVTGTQPELDSLIPPSCVPKTLHLIFSDPIKCSSIAADGSDFIVTGSSAVNITSATGGDCSGNLTNQIDVTLASPISSPGSYQIAVANGSDGNTLNNACDNSVIVGSSLSFEIKTPVSADFDYTVAYGCNQDTIQLNYLPQNGVNLSVWNIDSAFANSSMSPALLETSFGLKTVQHIVSNGNCNDTLSKIVNLDNLLTAAFNAPNEVCPKSEIAFTNTSVGNIISYHWDFGDGTSSTDQDPPKHLFPDTREAASYMVHLIIQNSMGCQDTASEQIFKFQTCNISVPNAFTPNGDGKNDFLYPLNAYAATDLRFQVFNRYGQLVFETRDWTKKWDGRMNGQLMASGTYVWMLSYTDGSGKKLSQRGTTILIR